MSVRDSRYQLGIPQKTRAHAVTEVLHAAILDGRLPPGTRLNQDQLAQELGVSRMPVREALKEMEIRGLVVQHPYRGAEVSQLSASDVEEIFEMRIALECLAIRRAVPLLQTDHFELLRETLATMDALVGDPNEWLLLNVKFHGIIYGLLDWRHLQNSIDELRHNVERYIRLYVSLQGFKKPQEEHWSIFEACQAGDIELAEQLTTIHLRGTEQRLMEYLKSLPSPSLLRKKHQRSEPDMPATSHSI